MRPLILTGGFVVLMAGASLSGAADTPVDRPGNNQRREQLRDYLREHPEVKERVRAWLAEHPEAREKLREKIRERLAQRPEVRNGLPERGHRQRDP